MSGLVLKLSPKERVLINGAVIENGDRRSRLSIMTPDAHILRLRDAVHPEEANTPVRRACFAVQLVLSGDKEPIKAHHDLLRQVEDLSQVFQDADSQRILAEAGTAIIAGQHYRALKALRTLISREDRLLAVRPN
ncbi:flagellar biosynthesis repressor FlbT [Sulfitobacter sp. M57]|uniref:flagellar biosynthesis repressor FlbT n=1 Tax=unclassified Sulfitobacter TaxID=196795 RepID=UPI0023E1F8B8|nr:MULTISPECIES: flagellar biosynthesis repressor FlbT [unclassified Sulfitobacter]MDF3415195.1 flagellar biosynthesis repressor FlbT [Sulfitobacter sp. KE5]MDF3422676.1 flagellar biosynthesis repressor FlbT [Sulfitobacter sp. KE43]MDF3433741.1 flagellar biosynthesis repressor FlbT [Sulfitobacter sp. KE42]MDF3459381.1 flagellar biosynthesis repressor FlbT [Sulfitobacter sp. S74]MDF3463280.1 flagellar biosynthesis repressor FlbT [Sulfitobacter sp. Ks18]